MICRYPRETGNVYRFCQVRLTRYRKEPYVIIHFFHPDFERCHIMDSRLTVRKTLDESQRLVSDSTANGPVIPQYPVRPSFRRRLVIPSRQIRGQGPALCHVFRTRSLC